MQIVIGPDWKSTAAGWLSFALVTFGSLSSSLVGIQAARPNPNFTLAVIIGGITVVLGLVRVWVGWLQSYVQTTPTSTPTVPTVVTLPASLTQTVVDSAKPVQL